MDSPTESKKWIDVYYLEHTTDGKKIFSRRKRKLDENERNIVNRGKWFVQFRGKVDGKENKKFKFQKR